MQLPHLLIQDVTQLIHILFLLCRNKQAVIIQLRPPCIFQFVQCDILLFGRSQIILILGHPCVSIYFIKDNHRRFVCASKVFQRIFHHADLLLDVRMRDVHHVQQQVSLPHLIQCALERVHQVCGQFAYKPYRIRQQERQILYHHLPHCCVKRSKQFVLRKHLALRQQVHQGGFTHVGISHQCHANHSSAVFALSRFLSVNFQ